MGKRSFSVPTWTPNAFADTVALTNNNHMTLTANNATSGLLVQELEIGGQSGSSTVQIMLFARHSTIAVTPTMVAPYSDGPLATYAQLTSAGVLASHLAGTAPQRSANLNSSRLNLSFNGFGGIVRWQAAPFEEWGILGTAANVSESSLSAFTGSTAGAIGTHIIYEPLNS
jgi:hypothetical protein